jgi:hypothetical protein
MARKPRSLFMVRQSHGFGAPIGLLRRLLPTVVRVEGRAGRGVPLEELLQAARLPPRHRRHPLPVGGPEPPGGKRRVRGL